MKIQVLLSLIAATTIALAGCAADVREGDVTSTADALSDGPDVDNSPESLAKGKANTDGFKDTPALTEAEKKKILAKYESVQHPGVREELFEKAVLYYNTNYDRIPNKDWLTVVDFKLHSGKKRFFVIDMTGGPMTSHVTAHGKFSDENDDGYADSFSNVVGSGQSSIGFYYVAELYSGAYGESLRLDGLSTGTSNVRERAVVIHGSDYVSETRPKQGRSLGCFAMPWTDKPGIVNRLKAGSILFAWN